MPKIFSDAALRGAAVAGTTYLLIDRSCFLNQACFDRRPDETPCSASEVVATLGLVSTKYGHMQAGCAAALTAADWREVASVELRDDSPKDPRFIHDIPSADPVVRVALLELPSPRSRNELPSEELEIVERVDAPRLGRVPDPHANGGPAGAAIEVGEKRQEGHLARSLAGMGRSPVHHPRLLQTVDTQAEDAHVGESPRLTGAALASLAYLDDALRASVDDVLHVGVVDRDQG
jgi:hypothetical protein